MADSCDSAEVEGFLADHVESLEQLQTLILLHRSNQDWSPQRVAQELSIPLFVAEESLRFLSTHGLLASGGAAEASWFRYRPVSDALDQQVERLVQSYSERRVDVLRSLTAHAIERLRAGALGVFSSALTLRRSSPRR